MNKHVDVFLDYNAKFLNETFVRDPRGHLDGGGNKNLIDPMSII